MNTLRNSKSWSLGVHWRSSLYLQV